MSAKYIKNIRGRGVLLRDTRAIAELNEKNAVNSRLQFLQDQIDKLKEQVSRLENGKKE